MTSKFVRIAIALIASAFASAAFAEDAASTPAPAPAVTQVQAPTQLKAAIPAWLKSVHPEFKSIVSTRIFWKEDANRAAVFIDFFVDNGNHPSRLGKVFQRSDDGWWGPTGVPLQVAGEIVGGQMIEPNLVLVDTKILAPGDALCCPSASKTWRLALDKAAPSNPLLSDAPGKPETPSIADVFPDIKIDATPDILSVIANKFAFKGKTIAVVIPFSEMRDEHVAVFWRNIDVDVTNQFGAVAQMLGGEVAQDKNWVVVLGNSPSDKFVEAGKNYLVAMRILGVVSAKEDDGRDSYAVQAEYLDAKPCKIRGFC